jgi:preprotein translocase subunit SecA
MDLPPQDRQATLDHLQRREWFLDRQRLEEMQAQSLGALDIQVRQELVDTLRREQLAQLGQQRLGRLRPDQYQAVLRFLRQEGLAVEENHMRALRRQSLQALDRDLYHDLVQDLGRERVAEWNAGPFRNLEPEQQAELSAYLGRRIMAHVEQRILLHTISRLWIDYLTDIEDLRRGIGLEAYGQRDPLVEYKRRAFELFEELGDNIRRTVARSLFRRAPEPLVAQPSN